MSDEGDSDTIVAPQSIVQSRKPVPTLGQVRRPHLLREVEVLARTHTVMCIEVLAEIARDRRNPAVARVAAADSLLNRGWGRAPLMVQVDSPVEVMSDEQLADAIRRRLVDMQREGVPDAEYVDVVPEPEAHDDDPTDV